MYVYDKKAGGLPSVFISCESFQPFSFSLSAPHFFCITFCDIHSLSFISSSVKSFNLTSSVWLSVTYTSCVFFQFFSLFSHVIPNSSGMPFFSVSSFHDCGRLVFPVTYDTEKKRAVLRLLGYWEEKEHLWRRIMNCHVVWPLALRSFWSHPNVIHI